jgi:hypothetical protein
MEAVVEARTGARHGLRDPARQVQRNGYRERAWDTRAGRIPPFPRSTGRRSPAPIRSSASTAKSNAAPMSSASFPMIVPSFDRSVR